MGAFLGMRGTGDWVTDQRPKSWRETLLMLYPNGEMPLTAILSKMGEEQVDDPEFNWWTKKFPDQAGAVTGVYTDTGLSAAYSSSYASGSTGCIAGTTLYVKMAEATAKEFRLGHQILLRDASDPYVDVNCKVTVAPVLNGASSYLTVKTLEADDNSYAVFAGASHNLSDCDRVMIIGNINAEGAAMPSAVTYDPTKYYNYTQIFRTPLSITRTARKTKLRGPNAYQEAKREALELHGVEMEKAFIWGIPSETNGGASSGTAYPERTTQGIINFVRANVPANFNSYDLNSTYSGKAWTATGGGELWLDNMLEQLFRFGTGEKLGVCGSGVLLAIQQLVKAGAHMNITPTITSYGLDVVQWVTPFGRIYLKMHPLMSQEVTTRKKLLLLEPKNLKYKYIDDTVFYGEGERGTAAPGTNYQRLDATNEEFLTEAGLELHHPDTFMILDGFGNTNAV
jgi:hypothetical protein